MSRRGRTSCSSRRWRWSSPAAVHCRVSRSFVPDVLALVFAAFVVVYALIPQSGLDGGATHKGVAYALRHDLLIVGAYFLGRRARLTEGERPRLCRVVLGTAAFVAVFGLVDVYAVSLAWWRLSAGWFWHRLGLDYGPGLSHLPQNFVYNAGEDVVFRRLTSTFLSPLATAYLLVVAMFFIPLRRWWGIAVGALLFAAILWTHTRAAVIALAAGLLVLAVVRRRVQTGRLGAGGRGRGVRLRQGLRPLRSAHALHRGGEARAGTERVEDAFRRRTTRLRWGSPRRASTCRACATVPKTVLKHPLGSARQRRRHRVEDARRPRRRGSRPTRSSASRPACWAVSSSSPGRSRCCAGRCAATRGSVLRSPPSSCLGSRDRRDRRAVIAVVVWAVVGGSAVYREQIAEPAADQPVCVVADGEAGCLEGGSHSRPS